jgi:putative ABC transport system ATP-binding protein
VALIATHELTRAFGSLRALDALSLEIAAGEWVAVTGPSGSGKTTLLNILAGLDRPTGGRVVVDGLELQDLPARDLLRHRRERVGLVFQQFHLIPYLTALENVMLAQYVHSMTDRAEAREALERVGLGARLDHLPRQLSGGEQQRVCIARALVNHPSIVLADEPTGNLDGVSEALVVSLLADLHRRGHTLVLVTHDLGLAARADREVRLEHGREVRPDPHDAEQAQALLAELWRLLEEEGGGVSVERRGVAQALAAGILRFAEGRIAFTPAGRLQAAAAVRRYRLAETLLARALTGAVNGHCGKALPLAPAVVEEVCAFLDHPRACPHGRSIPGGSGCCDAAAGEPR